MTFFVDTLQAVRFYLHLSVVFSPIHKGENYTTNTVYYEIVLRESYALKVYIVDRDVTEIPALFLNPRSPSEKFAKYIKLCMLCAVC